MLAQEVAVFHGVFLPHPAHRLGAFVIHGLQLQVGKEFQCPDDFFQMQGHAFGLGLNHGGVTIDIHDKPRQAIALGMRQTVAIRRGIAHQAHGTTYLQGMLQFLQEEPLVDFAVVEA